MWKIDARDKMDKPLSPPLPLFAPQQRMNHAYPVACQIWERRASLGSDEAHFQWPSNARRSAKIDFVNKPDRHGMNFYTPKLLKICIGVMMVVHVAAWSGKLKTLERQQGHFWRSLAKTIEVVHHSFFEHLGLACNWP
ncbi:MAG: hypothetical protein ABI651_20055, partial [Verrucomicrobiota bacterium]